MALFSAKLTEHIIGNFMNAGYNECSVSVREQAHWPPLTAEMRLCPRFQLSVGPARVYVNDERSRTFLGLTVTSGAEAVAETSRSLDRRLAEYGLPPFYEVGHGTSCRGGRYGVHC